MFFVVVFSLRLYLISSLTIHILLSLLSFFLSFHFITHINSYHHSIYSKDFPDPLLRALPHLRASGLFPRPRAWDERAAMITTWRAWIIGAGWAAVFVPLIRLSAHLLLGND